MMWSTPSTSRPPRGAFDQRARRLIPRAHIAGLQTLPWACRIESYGRLVRVFGRKRVVDIAVDPREQTAALVQALGRLLHTRLDPLDSFLALTLANMGQIIHPGIMYGLFGSWDGRPYPVQRAPLFYGGVTQEIADILQSLSDEVQAIARELEVQGVHALYEWLRRAYAEDIEDASSLRSCFVTNRAYADLRAPMVKVEGGLVPDFQHRYLTEDVPYGLLVTRHLAESCGVKTPTMDAVIHWAKKVSGL